MTARTSLIIVMAFSRHQSVVVVVVVVVRSRAELRQSCRHRRVISSLCPAAVPLTTCPPLSTDHCTTRPHHFQRCESRTSDIRSTSHRNTSTFSECAELVCTHNGRLQTALQTAYISCDVFLLVCLQQYMPPTSTVFSATRRITFKFSQHNDPFVCYRKDGTVCTNSYEPICIQKRVKQMLACCFVFVVSKDDVFLFLVF